MNCRVHAALRAARAARAASTAHTSSMAVRAGTTRHLATAGDPLAAKADTSSAHYQAVFHPDALANGHGRLDTFARRHLGPTPAETAKMLETLGYADLDAFLEKAVPPQVLFKRPLSVEPAQGYSELEMLEHLAALAGQNRIVKSFIGKGYSGTRVPPVVQRNLLELPEWYTSYTPYQPEISQGRLESLLNYQTMVSLLTGLPMANASLLDEGTAAAEAMAMSFHSLRGKRLRYVADAKLHPQTLAVVRSRAANIGVEVVVLPLDTEEGVAQLAAIAPDVCGVLVQYPATDGSITDFQAVADIVHGAKGLVAMATDLLALTVLRSPAEFGADIALGTSQRFGVPFGFGGPHAAFFATSSKYARKIPGRIVGVSKDRLGQPALRLALQTREQHIKRENATLNICTAQALLANMAAMYAVYHGPKGLQAIAERVYGFTAVLAASLGDRVANARFFDTLTVRVDDASATVDRALHAYNINLFRADDQHVLVALDETTTRDDVEDLVELFTGQRGAVPASLPAVPSALRRHDAILTHPVFNSHHSETAMLRYLHLLQQKDLSLANSMIPLGSCTMKLNATVEMMSLLMPGFAQIHPFAPPAQTAGYRALIAEFEKDLNDITGFDATTSMPNLGAQGEYTGLTLIRKYHAARHQDHRNVCLIPVSAHGTNPALAAMCGLKVVPVKCRGDGSIDLDDLEAKAALHADRLAAIMITYPSTYGLFEPGVKTAIDTVHRHGGLVYLDGANMNAQVGLTSPGDLGADVCHLNIHKTFALSHGGGGPGQAPVCVKAHLAPFLPKHHFVEVPHATADSIEAVNSAPYGSAAVIPVSYLYIKMLGARALPYTSTIAMLNANYMLSRLQGHYQIMFVDAAASADQGLKHCAHEFILDLREFKLCGVEAIDVAKRLQDYGFHAPTMSFPIAGTLMIEPTESENLAELDRFVDALLLIRTEIDAFKKGSLLGGVLKNAPHSLQDIISTPQSEWDARGYTREQAAYPLPYLKTAKCWPTVARVDDTYGDINLMCTCPSVEEVVEQQSA